MTSLLSHFIGQSKGQSQPAQIQVMEKQIRPLHMGSGNFTLQRDVDIRRHNSLFCLPQLPLTSAPAFTVVLANLFHSKLMPALPCLQFSAWIFRKLLCSVGCLSMASLLVDFPAHFLSKFSHPLTPCHYFCSHALCKRAENGP